VDLKALRALEHLGPSRSIDVSEYLDIAPRTVTGAVDALESEGLVERRPHPTDRRARLLVVTEAGEQRLDEALRVHRALLRRATSDLDTEQREQFLELVGIVTTSLTPSPTERHA
jgi:DNA-binding MarR family transcriptional regulator